MKRLAQCLSIVCVNQAGMLSNDDNDGNNDTRQCRSTVHYLLAHMCFNIDYILPRQDALKYSLLTSVNSEALWRRPWHDETGKVRCLFCLCRPVSSVARIL
jgi:hypothetical protein